MSIFIKCFFFLELLIQLLSVFSYTVVLKPVKPLYPSVKVYRYEVRYPKFIAENNAQYIYAKPVAAQRLYPVIVKQPRDPNFRSRGLLKKEKRKFVSKALPSTTEQPVLRDQRLYGLPQQLVPPVSNKIEEYLEVKNEDAREQDNDIRQLLPSSHDEKSFSSFGQEKGKIYKNPGDWATPAPNTNTDNTTKSTFTPSQLYFQIRHKNTVIHVPQSEALKDAETLEELINAPRLKELARTSHVQEVYSEEGYEDAGYDHAGHIRHAQHGEVYNAKDEGKFRIKEAPIIIDYDSSLEESKRIPLKNISASENNFTEENPKEKPEPRITRSRSETSKTSFEYAKVPHNYKGGHKYSSKVKSPLMLEYQNLRGFNFTTNKKLESTPPTFPSYFDELHPEPEFSFSNKSFMSFKPIGKKSSKYRKNDLNSTRIYPVFEVPDTNVQDQTSDHTDFKPHKFLIDSQTSPSAKSLKYSRIYSKKTKQLRVEPYNTGKVYNSPTYDDRQHSLPQDITNENESVNQRIVLPTIGYINSLTTAHFGNGGSMLPKQEPKTHLMTALNLSQALNYLRSNINQVTMEPTEAPTESDIRTFEPMRLKKFQPSTHYLLNKTKRDVHLVSERDLKSAVNLEENIEGNDESDQPHNEKNEEIVEDEKKRIEEENREKEKYEMELKKEISEKEKEILKETFKNIGIKEDISEVFPDFPMSDMESKQAYSLTSETKETPVDEIKYPFYFSKKLPENSPLRYATDPKKFPRKSGFKMEFYESREGYIHCPEFHPDLEDLPNSNSTEYSEKQAGENQRLAGLGDKIACLRMKYFDIEPFDNPIFKEKEIEYVGKRSKKIKNLIKKLNTSETEETQRNKNKNFRHLIQQSTNNEKKHLTIPKNYKTINVPERFKIQYRNEDFRKQNDTNQTKQFPGIQTTKTSILPKIYNLSSLSANLKAKERGIIPLKVLEGSLTKGIQNTLKENPHHKRQTTSRPKYQANVLLKPSIDLKEKVIPYNCNYNYSKLTMLEDKTLILNCRGSDLFQKVKNDQSQIHTNPTELKKQQTNFKNYYDNKPKKFFMDETEWVPIVGYKFSDNTSKSSVRPFNRKTDEVTKKNETSLSTNSDHYVIDELKEDDNVRKGEVLEDMDHYLKIMQDIKTEVPEEKITETESLIPKNATRRKRQAKNSIIKAKNKKISTKRASVSIIENIDFDLIETFTQTQTPVSNINGNATDFDDAVNKTIISRPFESKRTLTRITGRDFLVRYHKNKAKPITQEKRADFWKISTLKPVINENFPKVQNKPPEFRKRVLDISSKTNSNNTETKESSEIQKTTLVPVTEKYSTKLEPKQINEFRKILPSNIIPEKITNKPETKQTYEFRKVTTLNPSSEKSIVNQGNQNLTTITSKVKISESSEKPYENQKILEELLKEPSSFKQKVSQYETINRNSSSLKKNEAEKQSRYTEGSEEPILYYVVDGKTGRGKWITNYEEQKKKSNKRQKTRNLNHRSKTHKRKKKRKN